MCDDREMTPEEIRDRDVAHGKAWRKHLDDVLQDIKVGEGYRRSRERSLAMTKIQEAIMWLGMDLKAINDGQSCYPGGYDPADKTVHPVADGLKM